MMKTSLRNMRKRFNCWREISRQRRELREHGAAICKDIGVSQATLDFESKSLFWKEETETPDSFQWSEEEKGEKGADLFSCLDG